MRHSNNERDKKSKKSNNDNKGKKKMTTTYQYTTNYTPKCDHKPTMIQVGDTKIGVCARRNAYLAVADGFDVISPLVDSGGNDFYHFYGMLLWFPIADMTAPPVKRLEIHAKRLIDLARAGNNVITFCEGGHGRTGTVIATCIALLEPDVDPIDAVRERHCENCVETQSQVEAIFKAAKRPLPLKWRPEEREKKYQPKWVQQGKLWTNATESLVPTFAGPKYTFNECDYCGGADTKELGRLHWFGSTVAHAACYETECVRLKAVKAEEEAAKIAANSKLLASAMGGTVIHSSSQPSADSPPPPKSPLGQLRPFCFNWTPEVKANVATCMNKSDQFGDLICPDCHMLITDATSAQIYNDPAPVGRVLVHTVCDAAFRVGNNIPLCPMCNHKSVVIVWEKPATHVQSIKTVIVQKYCEDCSKTNTPETQVQADQI